MLPAPALTSPADGFNIVEEVTLSWQPVAGTLDYIVEFAEEGYCPRIIQTTEPSLSRPALQPGRTYSWRVATRSAYAVGPFSPKRTFLVVVGVRHPHPPVSAP